jgi:hypothetical protein
VQTWTSLLISAILLVGQNSEIACWGSLPKPLKITTLSVVAARSDERFLPYTHVHAVLISHEFWVQSLANPPIEKI